MPSIENKYILDKLFSNVVYTYQVVYTCYIVCVQVYCWTCVCGFCGFNFAGSRSLGLRDLRGEALGFGVWFCFFAGMARLGVVGVLFVFRVLCSWIHSCSHALNRKTHTDGGKDTNMIHIYYM